MPAKPERVPTLFQAATVGGRIIRQPQLVQFVVDGNGAMVVATQEFVQVEKWANSRFGSGNRLADRGRFTDQFQTLVARPGSFVGTRGSTKPLEDLCKIMKAAGYDLAEWHLPPELKNLGHPAPPKPAPAKPAAPDASGLGADGPAAEDGRPG